MVAQGALLNSCSGTRPCGLRGLFATKDLDKEEMACWIPNEEVLEVSTCDSALLDAIRTVLEAASLNDVERSVYERMMCLSAGMLLEKTKGSASPFNMYINSLPEPPPTVNTFSPDERRVLALMNGGSDFHEMYQSLVELTWEAVQNAVTAGLWGGAAAPAKEEVNTAFFFVLSRMSYMRMIPIVDLANAALPGEENARIVVEGQAHNGCAVVTKKPVAKGEELLIDYNHHNAIGMLSAYGCTLDLERSRSVTVIQFAIPQWLKEIGGGAYSRGVQLREDQTTGLEEHALLMLRMATMGDVQEVIEAVEAGYFKEPCTAATEVRKRWDGKQIVLFNQLARFCAEKKKDWQDKIKPEMQSIEADSFAGQIIVTQYDTEMRLLQRCEDAMLRHTTFPPPAAWG
jgi:hypothetical protein